MIQQYEVRHSSLYIKACQRTTDYPARFHKELEVAFVEKGTLDIMIDSVPYTLHEGDLYLVFPNLLHTGRRGEDGACITIAIADGSHCPAYTDVLTHSKPANPVLRKGSFPGIVYDVLRRMAELGSGDIMYRQSVLAAYLNAVLGELLARLDLDRRDSDHDLIRQLILFFLDNYTKDITLDNVAESLNYSKYYISHVISETFGCNFRPLINSYRVNLAQNLLLSSNKSIGEIAGECGFKNQSSFNRIFLKHIGMTPSVYRRQQEPPAEIPSLFMR